MGYYSEVRCVIYGEPEHMLPYVTALKLTHTTIFKEWAGHISEYMVEFSPNGLHVLDLNMSSVKWYPEFSNVRDWIGILHDIDEQHDYDGPPADIQYEFMRVGEELDDVERRRSCTNECFLNVRVTVDEDLPVIIASKDDIYGDAK